MQVIAAVLSIAVPTVLGSLLASLAAERDDPTVAFCMGALGLGMVLAPWIVMFAAAT